MKRSTIAFALATILPGIIGCTKESIKNAWSTQETNIETFVNSQLSADSTRYAVYNEGTARVVITQGSGDSLASDGVISFYYAGYVFSSSTISSSTLFATNYEDIASSTGFSSLTDSTSMDILTVRLDTANFVSGLANGLVGVKGGEECYILFSGEHGFGNKALGAIPANSALCYHIWVESISND